MRHGLFAVKDSAADAFLPPFCLPTDGMAIREFTYACQMNDHKFHLHPQDYSLYKIGMFDDSAGTVISGPEPVFLIASHQVQAVPAEPGVLLDETRRVK